MKMMLIAIAAIIIVYFLFARMYDKRKKADLDKKIDKPKFKTDEDVDEYAKPMDDDHQNKVDFEDAE